VETLRQAWMADYALFQNGIDNTTKGDGMANVLYVFYLSKIFEFGDTMIMALKKNFHQISFLHLYHHTSIFCVWWAVVYYAPGGESYFSCAMNSFIHVLMYGYYLWATFASWGEPKPDKKDPKAPKKRATWRDPAFYKQYITSLQMTQFLCMYCQSLYDLYYPVPNYPRLCCWMMFFYMMTMMALFANFFFQTYCVKKRGKPVENKGE